MSRWMPRFVIGMIAALVLVIVVLIGMTYAPFPAHRGNPGAAYHLAEWEDLLDTYPPPPDPLTYRARDGAELSYRRYDAPGGAGKPTLILSHGTASSNLDLHPLALNLQQRGFTCLAPDLRGHGLSTNGKPGDIDHISQLEKDWEDFLDALDVQDAVFIGHSASGGTTWWYASKPKWRDRYLGFVAIAPMMGLDEELNKEPALSNFALVNMPRVIACTLLTRVGITAFNHRPVLRFYRYPVESDEEYDWTNTYALATAHIAMTAHDYRDVVTDVPADTPMLTLSASDDESFTDRGPILRPLFPTGSYLRIAGTNHMTVLASPQTADAVAAFVRAL